MFTGSHQIWATVSGTDRDQIAADVEAVVQWGVEAIEFRLDLVPPDLWKAVLVNLAPPIPWWVAHFGTGSGADAARSAVLATLESEAAGAIFHSRCEHLDELVERCRAAGADFAAPYHSQEPLTLEAALAEYAHQQSISPKFRKIAVRAKSFDDAYALLEATRRCSTDGGAPVVGAVFGQHRWARVAMPTVGSTITFIVARKVPNEVGGDDEQLQLAELEKLLGVRGLMMRASSPRVMEQSLSL